MWDWTITDTGFQKDKTEENGNKFLVGNGYMGVRGILEEFTREQLAAVNLSGIYDKVGGGWREPLNAPNALYAVLSVDGKSFHILENLPFAHKISLNYEEAVFRRETTWRTEKGTVLLETERFADMESPNFLFQKYRVTVSFPCEIRVIAGIDGDVWDIHGPHYTSLVFGTDGSGGRTLYAEASTQNRKDTVWVEDHIAVSGEDFTDASMQVSPEACKGQCRVYTEEKKHLRSISLTLEEESTFEFTRQVMIYTSKDSQKPDKCTMSYEEKKKAHIECWKKLWSTSRVTIEGDEQAMEALNYSLYHLLSAAPRHSRSLSVPARGLSGQMYKGAVFWDTEMFMLNFFLYTQPRIAGTLLKYRIDTLPGALEKAAGYGYEGAFYPWESQEGGFDACSDYNVTDVFTGRPMRTYFKDKQIHISAAVVYGMMRYVDISGDRSLLEEGGLETIIECARFYYGLLVKKVSGNAYELHDVIGPDEYHERVNNNGYTNRMAKYTLETACELLCGLEQMGAETVYRIRNRYEVERLKKQFLDGAEHIYLPCPDENGIIEQFDGYRKLETVSVEEVRSRLLHEKEYWGGAYGVASDTQVIKQADVVTWLTLFAGEFPPDVLMVNWNYYEPRTEHGSSLSACMYAQLACLCGMQEKAYPLFMKSAMADLKGGGKQWAGLVYIGGTHPAAAGGAYMTAIHGFAGISFAEGKIRINPKFPKHWKKMCFHIYFCGVLYEINIKKEDNGEYFHQIVKCM